jgi:thiol-disulfide isomerase/thioredoxin
VGSEDLIDACEVWPELKCGMVSLIDSVKVKKELPPPELDEASKKTNLQKLIKFVEDKENAKVCIVIFAHWCPHCKTLISDLIKQANSGESVTHKYLLVNGESVASEAFSGDRALFQLKHYPTILCKIGNMGKEADSLESAKKMLDEAGDVSAEKDDESESKQVDDDDSKAKTEENMLDSLF